jgi:EpsI family protein
MIKLSRFIIVYVLLGIVALYINLHSDIMITTNKPLTEFPVNNKGWRMFSEAAFSENVLSVLKPTDYLSRQYVSPDGNKVSFYLGYHGGGKESGGIHSPKHCLPGSGWYEVSSRQRAIVNGGKKINLVEAVYQKGENKELFLYWFQVRGKTLDDEYSLKLSEILNSLLYRRRDSAFVRISVPFEADENKAKMTGEQFVMDFDAVIQKFLPI